MVVLSGSMICASSELIPPAVNLGMFNQPFGAKCSSVIFGPTRSQPAQLSLATAATYGLPLFFPALVPIHRPVGRTSKPAGTAMGTNLLDSIGAARGIRTPDPVITNYGFAHFRDPRRYWTFRITSRNADSIRLSEISNFFQEIPCTDSTLCA